MHAKVLLACVAAERGHTVTVGDMREIFDSIEYLRKGVYLTKSIPEKTAEKYRRLKSLGCSVSGWCEEGLVFRTRDIYGREKVSREALEQMDLFFAWGENQARAIVDKAPEAAGKIRLVGNARIDLIRPPSNEIYKEEADALREKYGSFILFNTNFSIANNILGTKEAFLDFKERGKVKTKEEEDGYWRFHDHKYALFEAMKDLVRTVSECYPQRRIIVRPHPSENHDTWREVVQDLDNAEVVFEGTAIPWLMGADVLIHNGCTTAIEAHYLGTPAIAFRPVVKEGFELELPNSVSFEAGDEEGVKKLLTAVTKKEGETESLRAMAAENLRLHIADQDAGWASDRIIEELEKYYGAEGGRTDSAWGLWASWGRCRTMEGLRALKHRLEGKSPKGESGGQRHRRQKLPSLTIGEIETLIQKLSLVSGRFQDIRVKPARWTKRCFVFEAGRG